MFRKVDVAQRMPPMGAWVTTIDTANEHRVYRLTEHGWNMRDADGINSPNNNLPITHWLEPIEMNSTAIMGDARAMYSPVVEGHNMDWTSFNEGWILGRMALAFRK
nr:hypothetical protein A6C57_23345 [Fibrella sp. ES10-3-2-2]